MDAVILVVLSLALLSTSLAHYSLPLSALEITYPLSQGDAFSQAETVQLQATAQWQALSPAEVGAAGWVRALWSTIDVLQVHLLLHCSY